MRKVIPSYHRWRKPERGERISDKRSRERNAKIRAVHYRVDWTSKRGQVVMRRFLASMIMYYLKMSLHHASVSQRTCPATGRCQEGNNE